MTASTRPVGDLLREWRQRRRLSQLELACDAEVSTRHLSFVETGRSTPSREMILHLAEQLEVPLRERNALLMAAGYAPVFPERPLDDPSMEAARSAVERVLAAHEPFPALAIDRHWTLIAANRSLPPLLAGVDAGLLRPPVNVIRLSLHPAGVAPRIVNLAEWRTHLLNRLRRQIEITSDPILRDLLDECSGYPAPEAANERQDAPIAIPLQLVVGDATLTFLSTTTIFGTPVDVTLSEIAVESFFPGDAATAAALRELLD
jgi:transcriptional regulator with XRE-family HTH domain